MSYASFRMASAALRKWLSTSVHAGSVSARAPRYILIFGSVPDGRMANQAPPANVNFNTSDLGSVRRSTCSGALPPGS